MSKKFVEFDEKIISLNEVRSICLTRNYPGVRLTVTYEDGHETWWDANQYNDPQRDYEERIKDFYQKLRRIIIDEQE